MPDALLVEMVPAGFGAGEPGPWQQHQARRALHRGETGVAERVERFLGHQEFRDDRYTAALDLSAGATSNWST